jgi:hypothetical protein
MAKKSSRLIMNEIDVSKFNVFTSSIVVIFMVIMRVIYCRLFRGHVHLLKRKRSRHARILCTMKLQVCGHGTKKRGGGEDFMLTELMLAIF